MHCKDPVMRVASGARSAGSTVTVALPKVNSSYRLVNTCRLAAPKTTLDRGVIYSLGGERLLTIEEEAACRS